LGLTLKAAYPSEVGFKKIEFIVVNNIATKGTKEFEKMQLLDATKDTKEFEKMQLLNITKNTKEFEEGKLLDGTEKLERKRKL